MKIYRSVVIDGETIWVDFYYEPEEPASFDGPGSPATIEIDGATKNGEVMNLTDDIIEDLTRELLNLRA